MNETLFELSVKEFEAQVRKTEGVELIIRQPEDKALSLKRQCYKFRVPLAGTARLSALRNRLALCGLEKGYILAAHATIMHITNPTLDELRQAQRVRDEKSE